MNWFWNTLWKLFGDHEPKLPPVPRDENMKGLGWRGDRREVRPFDPKPERADAGQDIYTKHENIIKGIDGNGD